MPSGCFPSVEATVSLGTATSTWHHLVYTSDATGNKIYVDGAQATPTYTQGSSASQFFFNNASAGTTVYNMGQTVGFNQENFHGLIDDLRIYNRALTAAEVKQLYKLGVATVKQ